MKRILSIKVLGENFSQRFPNEVYRFDVTGLLQKHIEVFCNYNKTKDLKHLWKDNYWFFINKPIDWQERLSREHYISKNEIVFLHIKANSRLLCTSLSIEVLAKQA